MAEVPISKAGAEFVDAWERAVRARLVEKPPHRQDRRVLLGPTSAPEKHRHGLLVVGTGGGDSKGRIDIGDGRRLDKLGRNTKMLRDRQWPADSEVAEVQRLGVELTRELGAGAVRPYSHEPQDREAWKLADAIGTAVARFHYEDVVTDLASAGTISPEIEQAFRSGNDFAQRTPSERLVEAFADTVDRADGRLLERVHASEQADKVRVVAELLVNRSPVLQEAAAGTRTAAIEMLRETLRERLGNAMHDLDRSRESRSARAERADGLGRRIGADINQAVALLEEQAAPLQPDAEAARTAEIDGTTASRLAGDGVAGAGAAARGETGTTTAGAVPATTPKDRGTGSRTPHGNAIG